MTKIDKNNILTNPTTSNFHRNPTVDSEILVKDKTRMNTSKLSEFIYSNNTSLESEPRLGKFKRVTKVAKIAPPKANQLYRKDSSRLRITGFTLHTDETEVTSDTSREVTATLIPDVDGISSNLVMSLLTDKYSKYVTITKSSPTKFYVNIDQSGMKRDSSPTDKTPVVLKFKVTDAQDFSTGYSGTEINKEVSIYVDTSAVNQNIRYTHIAYSTSETGENLSFIFYNQPCLGIYEGPLDKAPTDPSMYKWIRIVPKESTKGESDEEFPSELLPEEVEKLYGSLSSIFDGDDLTYVNKEGYSIDYIETMPKVTPSVDGDKYTGELTDSVSRIEYMSFKRIKSVTPFLLGKDSLEIPTEDIRLFEDDRYVTLVNSDTAEIQYSQNNSVLDNGFYLNKVKLNFSSAKPDTQLTGIEFINSTAYLDIDIIWTSLTKIDSGNVIIGGSYSEGKTGYLGIISLDKSRVFITKLETEIGGIQSIGNVVYAPSKNVVYKVGIGFDDEGKATASISELQLLGSEAIPKLARIGDTILGFSKGYLVKITESGIDTTSGGTTDWTSILDAGDGSFLFIGSSNKVMKGTELNNLAQCILNLDIDVESGEGKGWTSGQVLGDKLFLFTKDVLFFPVNLKDLESTPTIKGYKSGHTKPIRLEYIRDSISGVDAYIMQHSNGPLLMSSGDMNTWSDLPSRGGTFTIKSIINAGSYLIGSTIDDKVVLFNLDSGSFSWSEPIYDASAFNSLGRFITTLGYIDGVIYRLGSESILGIGPKLYPKSDYECNYRLVMKSMDLKDNYEEMDLELTGVYDLRDRGDRVGKDPCFMKLYFNQPDDIIIRIMDTSTINLSRLVAEKGRSVKWHFENSSKSLTSDAVAGYLFRSLPDVNPGESISLGSTLPGYIARRVFSNKYRLKITNGEVRIPLRNVIKATDFYGTRIDLDLENLSSESEGHNFYKKYYDSLDDSNDYYIEIEYKYRGYLDPAETVDLGGNPTIISDLSDLPRINGGLILSQSGFSGDVSKLPNLTTILNLEQCSGISGRISDLPRVTRVLNIGRTSITGFIRDLPRVTESLNLADVDIKGSLSDLPMVTKELILSGISSDRPNGPIKTKANYVEAFSLSTELVDSLLIACSESGVQDGEFYADSRSSDSDSAVESLEQAGWYLRIRPEEE